MDRTRRGGDAPLLGAGADPRTTLLHLAPDSSPHLCGNALDFTVRRGIMRRGVLVLALLACNRAGPATSETERRNAAVGDTAFAAVQERGAFAMGVDQYTSTHQFTPTPDGGMIELQRDTADTAGVMQIRSHMRQIAAAFGTGDFSLPGMVHDQVVPGTDSMRVYRAVIAYAAEDLPRGAQVRITTAEPAAVRAIHAFLAFQRQDHKAGMHHTPAH